MGPPPRPIPRIVINEVDGDGKSVDQDAEMHDDDDEDDDDDDGALDGNNKEPLHHKKLASWPAGRQEDLIRSYFDVLTSIDVEPSILKRPLPDPSPETEPEAKRQKSSDPAPCGSVSDKVAAGEYVDLEALANDVLSAVKAALSELEAKSSDQSAKAATAKAALGIRHFKTKALEMLQREKAYPQLPTLTHQDDSDSEKGRPVLSVVAFAPHEKRLFSSLPASRDIDLSQFTLPPGVSISYVDPRIPPERPRTLGEVFASPRPLQPLQPPKQPKTQAKGKTLDFYHPELTDTSKYRTNCYYTTKLSAGHYLDYSNATPPSQTKTKQRERAQSLAGKKPSPSELEMTEMEALFRGAFSSFAPCKDDTAAVIPSSVAGRLWWQKSGQRSFQRMIEIEYYGDATDDDALSRAASTVEDLDEVAVQEAIDNWDDDVIDPSLEDVMGCSRGVSDQDVDKILEEVSDLIETLASYQRIRNLTLPNSHNRQSSDPVTGDMLATAGPQPSEEEQATYQMLKSQLALIIKTLPPYVVAKLNGDQLDDLLISTKIQVRTPHYRGVMEEDEAGVQARLRAQQQQQQQQHLQQQQQQAAQVHQHAQQAGSRPAGPRTPGMPTPYGPGKFQGPPNQYGTPSRPPQQFYRPSPAAGYQQPPRNLALPAHHQPRPPPPQANQYARPNGFPNQYATQLAKAQTPYGHQSMPQYASQQRPPQYAQMSMQPQQQHLHHPPPTPTPHHPHHQPLQPQQGGANARHVYPQGGYPQQAGNMVAAYTNGAPRTMSPQVPQRPPFSPSTANMPPPQQQQQAQQQQPRYPPGNMAMSRYPPGGGGAATSQNPGLTGYHTVIPEAQQQQIIDQAKARVAAQERSAAMFADKMGGAARAGMAGQPKPATPGGTARQPSANGMGYVPPRKVTPVPLPVVPGSQQQRKAS
ncbi:hypothetical protein CDD80_4810 [Ophiocordyceps camponoti-rufipedis]|uniref:Uncharacterized protein n=1 Tax=Ophiocordyceps camponoti-rufipedis TaxID=2004952 RepID=A0A2C5YYE3_9HYPO|nr:hypothetical protein CDD80_4810 [Ophiocordyceps camponoti-rufipedis]